MCIAPLLLNYWRGWSGRRVWFGSAGGLGAGSTKKEGRGFFPASTKPPPIYPARFDGIVPRDLSRVATMPMLANCFSLV